MISQTDINDFRIQVWDYYNKQGRTMPWRDNTDPYWILVSEVMLQQTQVARVTQKFIEFISAYPTPQALASSPLAEVLTHWSGLGYNRRAKFLWQAAQQIQSEHQGSIPATLEQIDALPGIGYNTAAAIMNYAYEQPVAFIETNIKTVLLHHFFTNQTDVSDVELLAVAEKVLDYENPRQWHWALMDYGTYLKAVYGGRLDQSRTYKKQPAFKGSLREMRGRIIKALTEHKVVSDAALRKLVAADHRYNPALKALSQEALISYNDKRYALFDSRRDASHNEG